MQVRHLVPILVLGAIVLHGGKAVKARVAGVTDVKGKVVVKQRLNVLTDALALEVSSGSDLPATQEAFQVFCAKRTRGGGNKDSQYRDPWGTILRYSQSDGVHYTIISAGPDLRFATADDLRVNGNAADY